MTASSRTCSRSRTASPARWSPPSRPPSAASRSSARAASGPDSMEAYDYIMRALPQVWALTRDGGIEALALTQRAIALEPNYALAHALGAWCHFWQFVNGWPADLEATRAEGLRLARAALRLDNEDPDVLAMVGAAEATLGRNLDYAAALIDKALTIDPNSAWAWIRGGYCHVYRGHDALALQYFERAEKLSPFDPLNFNRHVGVALAHFIAGRYELAVEAAAKALLERPHLTWGHRVIAAAYGQLGWRVEGAAAVLKVRHYSPGATVASVMQVMALEPVELRSRFAEGLRRAGLPDGSTERPARGRRSPCCRSSRSGRGRGRQSRRRPDRGHHHRPVAGVGPVRDGAQRGVRLSRQACAGAAGSERAGRALRAGRQRACRRRQRAHHRAADRRQDRRPCVGGTLRPCADRHPGAAGRDRAQRGRSAEGAAAARGAGRDRAPPDRQSRGVSILPAWPLLLPAQRLGPARHEGGAPDVREGGRLSIRAMPAPMPRSPIAIPTCCAWAIPRPRSRPSSPSARWRWSWSRTSPMPTPPRAWPCSPPAAPWKPKPRWIAP